MSRFRLDIISDDRGRKSFYTALIFSLVSAIFYVAITYFSPEFITICTGSSSSVSTWGQNLTFIVTLNVITFLGLFVFEVLRRLFLLVEEWKHKDKRYDGNLLKLLKKVFSFDGLYQIGAALLICLAFVIYLLATKNYPQDGTWNLMVHVLLAQIGIGPCIAYIIKIKALAQVEEDELNEKSLLNISQGFAWSYYVGYLKLILPGFEARIKDSENKIKLKKLLILFPSSCLIPSSIKGKKKISVTALENFETPHIDELISDVGGVKGRNYHNTVHRIKSDSEEEYLIVEYCTPLRIIYEMEKKTPDKFSKDKKKEQVQLLVNTLKKLLDHDTECKDKYELIVFNDEAEDFYLDEFLLEEFQRLMKLSNLNEETSSLQEPYNEQEMKPLCNNNHIV